ncbi:MAG: DHH family phosphoesterase, partial [Gammaproteobacteria bacterium]|nr:DHH family phosphoesterase [Gammaproteobacteria bacterium]
MKGLDPAASLLVTAIQQQSRILIIGDYDADGATSVALMIEGLRLLGARHVEYLVPNRFEYGYGLSPELVDLALTQRPDLIITVDQGIVSFEGVAAAKAAGVRVIVTDHHLPGQGLPAADAIVNPNQNGCEFPSKALAGVGVAFYLLIKTRALLVAALPEGSDRINLAQLLDLVALGTVADLVPLDENNRRLVQSGIKRIRAGRARPGIQALIEISGLDHRVLTTT